MSYSVLSAQSGGAKCGDATVMCGRHTKHLMVALSPAKHLRDAMTAGTHVEK